MKRKMNWIDISMRFSRLETLRDPELNKDKMQYRTKLPFLQVQVSICSTLRNLDNLRRESRGHRLRIKRRRKKCILHFRDIKDMVEECHINLNL